MRDEVNYIDAEHQAPQGGESGLCLVGELIVAARHIDLDRDRFEVDTAPCCLSDIDVG